MRTLIQALLLTTVLWVPAAADEAKQEVISNELKKWQGLWQTSPGGIEQRDGKQVVRQPSLDGPCFFVLGDRLIWLDNEGKPTGKEERIVLDGKADPKRVTLTKFGEGKGEKGTEGIYSATGSTLQVNLGLDGGPAPKQFLELNKPVKGVDGREWLVARKKLQGD
jgi:uncharacterized protein (TIGR03067 family)